MVGLTALRRLPLSTYAGVAFAADSLASYGAVGGDVLGGRTRGALAALRLHVVFAAGARYPLTICTRIAVDTI